MAVIKYSSMKYLQKKVRRKSVQGGQSARQMLQDHSHPHKITAHNRNCRGHQQLDAGPVSYALILARLASYFPWLLRTTNIKKPVPSKASVNGFWSGSYTMTKTMHI